MKTHEFTLDLQAYVDGELSPSKRLEVERVLTNDAEAREMVDGLRRLAELVRQNEPALRVPDSREFYWSQIQRRIAAAEAADAVGTHRAASASRAAGWLRWLAPALGVAAVTVVVLLPNREADPLVVAGSGVQDAVTMTYRSDSDGVVIHWID